MPIRRQTPISILKILSEPPAIDLTVKIPIAEGWLTAGRGWYCRRVSLSGFGRARGSVLWPLRVCGMANGGPGCWPQAFFFFFSGSIVLETRWFSRLSICVQHLAAKTATMALACAAGCTACDQSRQPARALARQSGAAWSDVETRFEQSQDLVAPEGFDGCASRLRPARHRNGVVPSRLSLLPRRPHDIIAGGARCSATFSRSCCKPGGVREGELVFPNCFARPRSRARTWWLASWPNHPSWKISLVEPARWRGLIDGDHGFCGSPDPSGDARVIEMRSDLPAWIGFLCRCP